MGSCLSTSDKFSTYVNVDSTLIWPTACLTNSISFVFFHNCVIYPTLKLGLVLFGLSVNCETLFGSDLN